VFDYVVKNVCTKGSEDDYTIVLLVTDGGVTDFEETKEVLVRNSHMPLSVVLVRMPAMNWLPVLRSKQS
jgi:hypothetical protein